MYDYDEAPPTMALSSCGLQDRGPLIVWAVTSQIQTLVPHHLVSFQMSAGLSLGPSVSVISLTDSGSQTPVVPVRDDPSTARPPRMIHKH